MKKIENIWFLFLIIFLLSIQSYCQKNINFTNLEVSYNVQRNNYESDYILMFDGNTALWEETSDLMPRRNANINFERVGQYMRKNIYSDINNSTMLSNLEVIYKKFYIKEDKSNLNWTLSDSTQTILGYKCSMATTNFRGREYIVFYTDDILTNIGPWKLHGLPGLILKVESHNYDEFYKIEATELKINKEKTKDYLKTFKNFEKKYRKKFQSWIEFEEDINKYINKLINYNKSSYEEDINDGGRSGFRLMNYLEIFHPSQMETIWYD
ncbi:MAG: GLPGLI family protein [Gelidibacter sp.]